MTSGGAERTDLKGMTLPELERFLSRWGKERYRARQLFRWIYQRFAGDFDGMTDLSKEFRGLLAGSGRSAGPAAERVEVSVDGTEKYLFRLEDGEAVESVLIPDDGRRTLCISSQVGCALGCGFCATGAMGFRRDMTSAEIVHQACFAAKRLEGRGERLSNVVFMGMGEPLQNVPEVSRAIEILLSQYGFGLSGKRVTVSTAGIVPEVLRLAEGGRAGGRRWAGSVKSWGAPASRRSPGSAGGGTSAPPAGNCVGQFINTATEREGPAEWPQEGGRPTPVRNALPGAL